MKIEMFDLVRLKTGEIGNIIEIFDNGAAFHIEMKGVNPFENPDDWIREVNLEDIECVIED
ncbi:MAG: hypothetical protein J6M62_05430 [Selenomonadaceae bacterium]|nr:hypothetical protein [Selenomonadaceae bacterium]